MYARKFTEHICKLHVPFLNHYMLLKLVIIHRSFINCTNYAAMKHEFLFSFSDVVKVLEDGDLQTLGLLDYDKRLKHPFTAHPKVDPFTGTLHGYHTIYYFL